MATAETAASNALRRDGSGKIRAFIMASGGKFNPPQDDVMAGMLLSTGGQVARHDEAAWPWASSANQFR